MPATHVMILGAVKTINPLVHAFGYPGFQKIFFFLPISNCKHGLFHIRYFDNGPLEPG